MSAQVTRRLAKYGPHIVIASLVQHWPLISRLTQRELAARYRGSAFGLSWAVLLPIFNAAVYTFVFTLVMPSRFGALNGTIDVALILFAGLSLFQFISESFNKAPRLVIDNAAYVKKVVFPVEILIFVQVLANGISTLIAFGVFLAFYLVFVGWPPQSAWIAPIIIALPAGYLLGVLWLLSGLGVFLRDLQQVIPPLTTALLFLSPIFYPLSAVPEIVRPFSQMNPIAEMLEYLRGVLFFGEWPDPAALALQFGIGYGLAWVGLALFRRIQPIFADVI